MRTPQSCCKYRAVAFICLLMQSSAPLGVPAQVLAVWPTPSSKALLLWCNNQAVGIAQGVMGVFGAASGVPAGFIADHTRRDRTLRGFGVVQLGARCTTLHAELYGAGAAHPHCLGSWTARLSPHVLRQGSASIPAVPARVLSKLVPLTAPQRRPNGDREWPCKSRHRLPFSADQAS